MPEKLFLVLWLASEPDLKHTVILVAIWAFGKRPFVFHALRLPDGYSVSIPS